MLEVLRLERRDGQQGADVEAGRPDAEEGTQGDAPEPSLAVRVVEQGGHLGRREHRDEGRGLVGRREDERGEADER